MKRVSLHITLIAGLLLAASHPGAASAQDGLVRIFGSVVQATCTLKGTGAPKTSDGKPALNETGAPLIGVSVPLQAVSTKDLKAEGDVAGQTAFSIAVSDCSQGKATLYFENGGQITAAGRLRNLSPSSNAAKNVEIQLLNTDLGVIDLNGGERAQNAGSTTLTGTPADKDNPAKNAGTLSYYARYYATGQATSGRVSSYVLFTVLYD
jgi:major type 1 subunit fimbrin (pilin)